MTPVSVTGKGQSLGSRYQTTTLLGSGAMGEVWLVWDRVEQGHRAAKLLRPEYTADPEILPRFIQERSILLTLQHPNIVRIHDLVVEGDILAIIMEVVSGPGLRGHLREHRTLPPAEAVEIAATILDALAAAHVHGALHRDVKPDNVLLGASGEIKLTDFGIARLAQESTVQATGLLGTPAYMPPELFEHGITSAASDVYAVGVTLYEMLAGRTPFAGLGNAHTVGLRHVTALPPPLGTPPVLSSSLAGMLAKNPKRRLSAAATADQLRALLPDLTGLPAGPVQPDPEAWERIESSPPSALGDIRVSDLPSMTDIGATLVRASAPPLKAGAIAATTGHVHAFLADATTEDSSASAFGATGVTRIRVESVSHAETPILRAGVKREPSQLRRVGLAVIGVIAATALLIVFIWLVSTSGTATHQADSLVPTSTNRYDIGLVTTSKAAAMPSGGVVLTLTYTYPYPLTGDLLIVLPSMDGNGECVTDTTRDVVAWGDSIRQAERLDDAFQDPIRCGYKLRPAAHASTMRSGPYSLTVTATIPLTSTPTAAERQAWLAAIDTQTKKQVQTYLGRTGDNTAFALQGLQGLAVHVIVRGSSVGYQVMGEWAGSNAPSLLFCSGSWCGGRDGSVGDPLATLLGIPAGRSAVGLSALARNYPWTATWIRSSGQFVSAPGDNGAIVTTGRGGELTVSAQIGDLIGTGRA